jgi:hypothetical protein
LRKGRNSQNIYDTLCRDKDTPGKEIGAVMGIEEVKRSMECKPWGIEG